MQERTASARGVYEQPHVVLLSKDDNKVEMAMVISAKEEHTFEPIEPMKDGEKARLYAPATCQAPCQKA